MNKTNVPRLLIAGTGSGCGKTTVSCAILQALCNRGLNVGAFKCGPDYIDPMFHSKIIGTESRNLDPFFFDENTLKYLLIRNGEGRDINVIEGVMGYYDGLSMDSSFCSTHELAKKTDTPAVLVVGAKGAALSVLAVIEGFLNFEEESCIKGVILNGCTSMTYTMIKKAIIDRFKGRVIPLGFMPTVSGCSLESRHLGLVTAAEVSDLREKMQLLAAEAEKSLDIDGIITFASSAPAICAESIDLPELEKVRIAVAEDKAFCFYYADSLDFLRSLGAELVSFSPMNDEKFPDGVDGLYLGGGYPELYLDELSANVKMLSSVKEAIEGGLPTIAECGGFMYLGSAIAGRPMLNVLPGESTDKGKLVRFGYINLVAKEDNMLCSSGQSIKAHEFHHWDSTFPGEAWNAEKPSGRSWQCAYATDTLYAGYPHFHFYANPDFGLNFYKACIKEKHSHDRTD